MQQTSETYETFPPEAKLNAHCTLSDGYLRLKAQPWEALDKLKPYYKEKSSKETESDDISIVFICPEGLTGDARILAETKVQLHLAKIFR